MEQEMKYIYTVYQHSSFSKAAQALYITQPALSLAVQRVESRIGMPLFDRTTKPIHLTEAGQLYIQGVLAIQNTENTIQEKINDLSELKAGTLRIGGTHYFNSYILPPVIESFMQKYPGINLQLIEDHSHHLLESLYDHNVDITFNCTQNPKDTFRRSPCFTDTLLLAVPKHFDVNQKLTEYALSSNDILNGKHKDVYTSGITLELFADTPFILLSSGNDLQTRCKSFFEQAAINPIIKLEVNQLVTAWHLACSGVGATFISDFLVKSPSDGMIFYRIADPKSVRVFDLIMSDRHYVSKAMSAFQSVFQEHYGVYAP
ncbi:MAG: LysR family transcriptional regulator [Eubacteriales bacterium]|nr:LysR family transcriptional regulator [Eubacteriales bacterium]